jgi:hypothetical protein
VRYADRYTAFNAAVKRRILRGEGLRHQARRPHRATEDSRRPRRGRHPRRDPPRPAGPFAAGSRQRGA